MWYEKIADVDVRRICERYENGMVTLEEVIAVMLMGEVYWGERGAATNEADDAFLILANCIHTYGTEAGGA